MGMQRSVINRYHGSVILKIFSHLLFSVVFFFFVLDLGTKRNVPVPETRRGRRRRRRRGARAGTGRGAAPGTGQFFLISFFTSMVKAVLWIRVRMFAH
jgi:hypothetical protein